jgi:hypothetical protein
MRSPMKNTFGDTANSERDILIFLQLSRAYHVKMFEPHERDLFNQVAYALNLYLSGAGLI